MVSLTEIEDIVVKRYPSRYPDSFFVVDVIDDLCTYFPGVSREEILELLSAGQGNNRQDVAAAKHRKMESQTENFGGGKHW